MEQLPWLGDEGGWEPGGEPSPLFEMPRFPLGDTKPPGPCREGCRCGQVVARPSELEKPWLLNPTRSRLVQEAMWNLERCEGVFRRGKVSRQNRFEPAPVSSAGGSNGAGARAVQPPASGSEQAKRQQASLQPPPASALAAASALAQGTAAAAAPLLQPQVASAGISTPPVPPALARTR